MSPPIFSSSSPFYYIFHTKISNHILKDNTLIKNVNPDDDMLDEDEEAAILSTVPDSLSAVTEADCPLILTFTKLLSMIDNSFPDRFLREADLNSLWSAEGGDFGSSKKENGTCIFFLLSFLFFFFYFFIFSLTLIIWSKLPSGKR